VRPDRKSFPPGSWLWLPAAVHSRAPSKERDLTRTAVAILGFNDDRLAFLTVFISIWAFNIPLDLAVCLTAGRGGL
jgi:hypothetical protein